MDLEKMFELGNGITVEEMGALYFDADALKAQPRKVYRVGGTAERVYYTFDENGEPFFYESVTTGLAKVMPTSPYLIDWKMDLGKDESERFTQERADYGTFLHIECSTLLIQKGRYDLDGLRDKLKQYIEEKALPVNFIYHEEELKKDVLAFAQWCIDYKVKPLAIEIILADEELGMGGALDLPCEITIEEKGYFGEVYKSGINKGLPKETKRATTKRVIVDMKSGRKGFYAAHIHQLEIYRIIWNKHYPETPIDECYNWAPKNWRGEVPTYSFVNQSDRKELEKLPFYLGLIGIERRSRKNSVLVCTGEINVSGGSLEANFENIHISELVKRQNNG